MNSISLRIIKEGSILKKVKKQAVAILGCGTVGGATAKLLTQDIDFLRKRTGVNFYLKYIIDINFNHAKELNLDNSLFVSNLDDVLADPEVLVVVELVGGTTFAKKAAIKILNAKKNLVTANKALLAKHGVELFSIARKNKVSICFEATCAGGIPIIRAIYDGLLANKHDALYGIVNGTCNYILTEMTLNGVSYKRALKEAQEKGLAEADPTLDVSGMDSAHKLAILSSITFGMQIDLDSITVSGIDKLDQFDINSGKELGYIIKLIAMARHDEGQLSLRVAPSFISTEHPLAWVSGPFNAISLYSHALGHSMYYGRGAGGSPTASAVVSDIIGLFLGTAEKFFKTLPIWPDKTKPAALLPSGEGKGRYYLRIVLKNYAGVLAKIAAVFADYNISISSVIQKEITEEMAEEITESYVPVVIITHKVREEALLKAIAKVDTFDFVKGKIVYISIMDEHEEIF